MTMPSFRALMLPFRTTARGRDLFHRHAVVALAVHHHVAVQGVEMTVNDAVICTGVLVSIGGAGRKHRIECALQDIGGIRGSFLRDVVRERDRQAFRRQSEGLFPLRRRDQVGGAKLVVFAPSSPVRELVHRAVVVRFVRYGRARIALTACLRDGSRHGSQRDQADHQDSHVFLRGVSRSLQPSLPDRRVPAAKGVSGVEPLCHRKLSWRRDVLVLSYRNAGSVAEMRAKNDGRQVSVKALGESVHEDPADKLMRRDRHGFPAAATFDAIVLPAEQ